MRSTDPTPPALVSAVTDAALRAEIIARIPLRYADGADRALDRPAHVRAGSGLAWLGDRLAVVQDDASFVALVDPCTGAATAVALPAGRGGARQFDETRGNKHHKLDLEACVAHDGELYAFGSGSTRARERVLRAACAAVDSAPRVALLDARELYAALRAAHEFSGSELNVEGAALVPSAPAGRIATLVLRLFQRGNGAARDGRSPVDATCDLVWSDVLAHLAAPLAVAVPALANVTRYDLGRVDGTRLTFTDGAPVSSRPGAVFYLAAAEASPDAYRDGPVAGCALGMIEPSDGSAPPRARCTPLLDAATGAPSRDKPEGVAPDPRDRTRLYVVVDRDDPTQPSELCTVALTGPW